MSESPETLPWCEHYLTGIAEIDEQHQRLVHLINMLSGNLANNPDFNNLDTIFTELAEYAMYHFQTEENIWHQYLANDPWETEHEQEHNSFVAKIMMLESEESSKPFHEVLENILGFLTGWLATHILEFDKRLATVVLNVQSGMSLEQAKQRASQNQ